MNLTLRLIQIKFLILRNRLEHWIFVHLCPGEYDHMRHLVDNVITLEQEKKRLAVALAGWEVSHGGGKILPYTITTSSNNKTYVTVEQTGEIKPEDLIK